MDFMNLVMQRRSVRSYADKNVDRALLDDLAEAVRLAPSATNTQPWRVIFVDDTELKNRVAEATFLKPVNLNRFTPGAPVIAVIAIEKQDVLHRVGIFMQGRSYPLIDIGIASIQLCLRAAELGLGTCMIGWFNERKIKKLLGIPARMRLGLLVTIGYPAADLPPREKVRKSLDETRTYNRFSFF